MASPNAAIPIEKSTINEEVAMPEIPPTTASVWEKLVTGKTTHKFSLFAANMAVARAARVVATDPSQKPAMIAELHQFFEKYATLTAADLQSLA
jgi:hypothetical protein